MYKHIDIFKKSCNFDLFWQKKRSTYMNSKSAMLKLRLSVCKGTLVEFSFHPYIKHMNTKGFIASRTAKQLLQLSFFLAVFHFLI